jgi:hypothetical protein
MWKWILLLILGFIGLYVLVRILSSAVFLSYFELKHKEEEHAIKKRHDEKRIEEKTD